MGSPKSPLLEGIKEFFRVVLLAILPVAVASVESGQADWKLIWTVGAIAGLRFIDKVLHIMGKEQDNSLMKRGLTLF